MIEVSAISTDHGVVIINPLYVFFGICKVVSSMSYGEVHAEKMAFFKSVLEMPIYLSFPQKLIFMFNIIFEGKLLLAFPLMFEENFIHHVEANDFSQF